MLLDIFYYFIYIISCNTINAEDIIYKQLIEGAEICDNMIVNAKGSYTLECMQIDTTFVGSPYERNELKKPEKFVTKHIYEVSFAYNKNKYNFNENSTSYINDGSILRQNNNIINDGEKISCFGFNPVGENELIIPYAQLHNIENYVYLCDIRNLNGTIWGTTVTSFLKVIMNNDDIQIIDNTKEVLINNTPCKVIRAYNPRTTDSLKVCIATSMMYRPLYIEKTTNKYKKIQDISYKKIDEIIWYLNKMVTKVYRWDEKTKDFILTVYTTIKVNDDIKVNCDIPDSLFYNQFPKGIKVEDFRTGRSFIVR